MDFPIPPELAHAVHERVRSGQYASTDEVLRAMLDALEEREAEHVEKIDALRREVRIGLDQLDRGERLSRDEVLKRLREARPGARL